MPFDDIVLVPGMSADVARRAVWSVLAILLIFGLRWALIAGLRRRARYLTDRQRWWISLIKNLSSGAVAVALVAIWAAEVQDAALSIAAVAVAVVIATKELWLCVTGATWRGVSGAFSVGDWIEIGGYSGEVVDENLLATVLHEIDRDDFYMTGRVVSVPNGLLLTEPVINHGFRKRFIFHEFDIHAEPHPNPEATRRRIQTALDEAAAEFSEIAQRYAQRIERRVGAQLRDPAPSVSIFTTELAKLIFRSTVFCPRDRADAMREAAMAAFLRE